MSPQRSSSWQSSPVRCCIVCCVAGRSVHRARLQFRALQAREQRNFDAHVTSIRRACENSSSLAFPPYLHLSANYYNPTWWREPRRLKNVVMLLEWVPEPGVPNPGVPGAAEDAGSAPPKPLGKRWMPPSKSGKRQRKFY